MGECFLYGQSGTGGGLAKIAKGEFYAGDEYSLEYIVQLSTEFIPDNIIIYYANQHEDKTYYPGYIYVLAYTKATNEWTMVFKKGTTSSGHPHFYSVQGLGDGSLIDGFPMDIYYNAELGTIKFVSTEDGMFGIAYAFETKATIKWVMWKE